MNKRNNQRRVLRRFSRFEPYQPFIGHSSMILVRWLLEQSDGEYEESEELKEEQIRQSLYRLEKKKYIKKTHLQDGRVSFELTKEGKTHAQERKLNDLRFSPPQKWDGKWRFVMFDVPIKSNYARDVLRDKLKRLGFFRAQQSVWVFPYDTHEELDFLIEFLHLQDRTLQFTGEVRNDRGLREHFQKKGFNLSK